MATTIMGVDPGSRNCGWAVIRVAGSAGRLLASGLIRPSQPHPVSLLVIDAEIDAALTLYQPDEIALESVFFNRNVSSAIKLGEARGVILRAALQHGVSEPASYTPQQAKKTVAGHGKADKDEVVDGVCRMLTVQQIPRSDHETDATAIAACHAVQLGLIPAAKARS